MSAKTGVFRITSCELQRVPGVWAYATDNAVAIDLHWQQARAANSQMFDGVIHLVSAATLEGGHFAAMLLRTDFKSFLYWRAQEFPETGVRDGFGSALIRSMEGHILLGRQRHGNINGGLTYLPGGFIDEKDVQPNGVIDIDASISRELSEETGLAMGDGLNGDRRNGGGYVLTLSGAQISIAREYRSHLTSVALRERVLAHLASDANSELADIVIVRRAADLVGLAMPAYAKALLPWLIADEGLGS
jgi:8-oxo-dGTP pyrophosphatase MutT (NUDIX family)